MRRIFSILLCLCMVLAVMPVGVSAEEKIDINIKSPSGINGILSIAPTITVTELKTKIAQDFEVTFTEDSFLYCEDIGHPNTKLPDDTKTLSEYGFQDGWTVHVEKELWDSPVHILGLTITGGVGTNEPYGKPDGTERDFHWNYATKTITIKTSTPLTIEGNGETGVFINVNNKGKYSNITLKNVSINKNGSCIVLTSNSWLKLTLEGTNTLVTNPYTEYGVEYKEPAISLNNDNTYLWITQESTGSLTATSNCEGMPGIGTCKETDAVYGIVMKNGTVTANGGKGAPGVRCNYVYISGGTLDSNAGTDSATGILVQDTDSMTGWNEGLLNVSGSGKVISKGNIQATTIVNKSELKFSDYDALSSTGEYDHINSTGKVYVEEDKYIWSSNESKWIIPTYSVTLNPNGGTINTGSITEYTYGTGAALPTDITREGYEFAGWYDNADFTGQPITEISAAEEGNKEFWAKWTELSSDNTVTSVTFGEITAEIDGTAIAITLPADSAIPDNLDEYTIVIPGTSEMTTPVSEDGLTWTFTVTAENGDTQNYTLIITIEQPEPEEPVQQSTPEYMAWLPGFLLMNTKYKLTAEAGEGGFITPEGTTKVQFGGNITYSITPMEGYAIKAVYVDGKDVGTPDEYTFRSVITGHSIRVEFEALDGE